MKRILSTFVIGSALLLPVAVPAQEGEIQQRQRQEQQQQQQRYYDRQSKDWHTWNDHEAQAYHRYQQDNHRQEREFKGLSKRDQANYFKWRHRHPDEGGR